MRKISSVFFRKWSCFSRFPFHVSFCLFFFKMFLIAVSVQR